MSLLNRASEHDHLYDHEGRLQGGLSSLETLARVIAIGSGDERERETVEDPHDEVEPALELPVTNPSRGSSLLDSDDDMTDDEPGSSDDDAMEEIVMDDDPPRDHLHADQDPQLEQSTIIVTPSTSSPLASDAASHRSPISTSPTESTTSKAPSTHSRRSSRRIATLEVPPETPVGEQMKQCFLDVSVLSTLLVRVLCST